MTLDPNDPDSWPPGEWDAWVARQPWVRCRLAKLSDREVLILVDESIENEKRARSKYPHHPIITIMDSKRICDAMDEGKITMQGVAALLDVSSKFGCRLVFSDSES